MKKTITSLILTVMTLFLTSHPVSAQGYDMWEPYYRYFSLTASPSLQRVYFGVPEGNPAYYAAGATVVFNYSEQMFGSKTHFLSIGAGASLRIPVRPATVSRKPDLWGFLEVGWRFRISRHFAMTPNLDFGLTKNAFGKGTFSAVGCEFSYRAGNVAICLTPKLYYNPRSLLGEKNQVAPAIDLGVRFLLKEHGATPDKTWL